MNVLRARRPDGGGKEEGRRESERRRQMGDEKETDGARPLNIYHQRAAPSTVEYHPRALPFPFGRFVHPGAWGAHPLSSPARGIVSIGNRPRHKNPGYCSNPRRLRTNTLSAGLLRQCHVARHCATGLEPPHSAHGFKMPIARAPGGAVLISTLDRPSAHMDAAGIAAVPQMGGGPRFCRAGEATRSPPSTSTPR